MIEAENVYKSLNGRFVLNGLTIDVAKGETLVIIGQSGCGKSVLLKHFIGVMKPDKGKILVDGLDVASLPGKELNALRMRFGMLFQSAALFDSMTVGENVGFALYEHSDLKEGDIRNKVAEALESVGLKGIENVMPSDLSGGMKKRVGLARAICVRPEILLYDEPTTGLDPIMADVINELIIELNHNLNITSVVVTHDMRSAYKIASRIAMMYEGKILQIGKPDEIRNTTNPVVRQFITGSASGPITDVRFKNSQAKEGVINE